jgi:copper chaperone CopZ
MKKILLFMILAMAAYACNQGKTGTEVPKAVTAAAIKTVKLGVEGMSCEGCENTIKEEVGKIDGVSEVVASHVDKFATISFDSTKTTLTALSEVITAAGYEVTGEQPLK